MAKWGEGDPRWIVEERPDAINPNNWHWTEKNATVWSRNRLEELLLNQKLEKGPIKIVFNEFSKLEGEASANNRKAKLIFFFEWTILIGFEATVLDSELVYKGSIGVINLSDEYEKDEIQISASIGNAGPHENQILHIINNEGLIHIRDQLGKYIQELKKEFSQGLILPTEKEKFCPQAVTTKGKTTIVNKREFQNSVVSEDVQLKSSDSSDTSTKNFELTQTFKVPPDHLFEIITKEELVKNWCPNSCVDAKEGGTFSLLGGLVTGTFTQLNCPKHISMKWRLKHYPKSTHANIKFIFTDKGDSVDLQVKAKGVPEEALEKTEEFFRHYYFSSIGQRFGITLSLF